MSLAWACAEYLATKLKALTLFATHYFELTDLPALLSGVANIHLDAVEHDEHIVFMHQVQPGAASKSYGLQVAQLAGVPKTVIQQARRKLAALEQQQPKVDNAVKAALPAQADLFAEAAPHPVLTQLAGVDPDDLTPRQALDLLFALKRQL